MIKYKDHSHLFTRIYIVNSFKHEIKTIGIEHFRGKEIIHVAAVGCDHSLGAALYKKLNVLYVQTNQLFPVINNFYKPIDARMHPSCLERKYRPTMGLFAVELALKQESPEELWMFGIDCYREPYLDPKTKVRRSKNKIDEMIPFLADLVKSHPQVVFYSASNKFIIRANNFNGIQSQ